MIYLTFFRYITSQSKIICVAALAACVSAFAPRAFMRPSTELYNLEKGAGGMFDTRNPDPVQHEDARKSISAAPSFEEYMKMRSGGGGAPAPAPAPAPEAYSPPAAAPASYSAPAPAPAHAPEKGAGGMFDTRNPDPVQHEDARKSISAAPSFEEYMKMRGQ